MTIVMPSYNLDLPPSDQHFIVLSKMTSLHSTIACRRLQYIHRQLIRIRPSKISYKIRVTDYRADISDLHRLKESLGGKKAFRCSLDVLFRRSNLLRTFTDGFDKLHVQEVYHIGMQYFARAIEDAVDANAPKQVVQVCSVMEKTFHSLFVSYFPDSEIPETMLSPDQLKLRSYPKDPPIKTNAKRGRPRKVRDDANPAQAPITPAAVLVAAA